MFWNDTHSELHNVKYIFQYVMSKIPANIAFPTEASLNSPVWWDFLRQSTDAHVDKPQSRTHRTSDRISLHVPVPSCLIQYDRSVFSLIYKTLTIWTHDYQSFAVEKEVWMLDWRTTPHTNIIATSQWHRLRAAAPLHGPLSTAVDILTRYFGYCVV